MLQCIVCISIRFSSEFIQLDRTSFWMRLFQLTPPCSRLYTSHSLVLACLEPVQSLRSNLLLQIRTLSFTPFLQSIFHSQSCKTCLLLLLPSQCNPHSCIPLLSGYRTTVLVHKGQFRTKLKFSTKFIWIFAFFCWQPPQQCSWKWVYQGHTEFLPLCI